MTGVQTCALPILPTSIAILVGLFLVQRKGTAFIGNIFGQVMLIWFVAIGLLGLPVYRHAEAAAIDKAKYWLDRVGLLRRADDPAGDLPYGEQRRVEIARAMCTDPVLLCLDEPAAGLNPRESAELNELLLGMRAEHKTSILLIEHDM